VVGAVEQGAEPGAPARRYAIQESTMPYALFENDDQLSRAFATEAEAWQHADDAGLVTDDNGKPALEDHYVIKPCPAAAVDQPRGEKKYVENWQLPNIKRAI
jgi:hypothetical protein